MSEKMGAIELDVGSSSSRTRPPARRCIYRVAPCLLDTGFSGVGARSRSLILVLQACVAGARAGAGPGRRGGRLRDECGVSRG